MDILHKLLILSLFSFVALFDAQAQQVVGEKNNLLQSKLPSNEEQKSVSGNLFESRQELSSREVFENNVSKCRLRWNRIGEYSFLERAKV